MSKLSAKVKEELEALLPPTLFFFVALHILTFIRSLMIKGTGVPLGTSASVAVAALILGKAVLLADLLPFVNRYPDYPLVYNIGWKTTLYALMATLIHYIERMVASWRSAGGFVADNEKFLAAIDWPRFWAIQIVLVTLILGYCTIHEVVRVIGRDTARRMFFGPMPSKQAS